MRCFPWRGPLGAIMMAALLTLGCSDGAGGAGASGDAGGDTGEPLVGDSGFGQADTLGAADTRPSPDTTEDTTEDTATGDTDDDAEASDTADDEDADAASDASPEDTSADAPVDTAPDAPEDTSPEDTAPEDTSREDTSAGDTALEDTAEDTGPEDVAPDTSADAALDTTPEDTAPDLPDPTCDDEAQNGDETGVDCGGPECAPCEAEEGCAEDSDCVSGVCDFATDRCVEAEEPRYALDEDFETGDLSRFDYTLTGDTPWEVVEEGSGCFEGTHCLRSSPLMEPETLTALGLDLWVREDTVIAFWLKLETEDPAPDEGEPFEVRLLIDDEVIGAWSGVADWQRVEIPIAASAPGTQPRSLRWEYERTSFRPMDRPVRNTVLIDAIEMPDWNTTPSTPELLTPGDGVAVSERQPTFTWRSTDPDFDPILYALQLSTTPDFAEVINAPESSEARWTADLPLEDGVTWFWRVRAKDTVSFQWSPWSATRRLTVDTALTGGSGRVWRQDALTEFDASALTGRLTPGMRGDAEVVQIPAQTYSRPSASYRFSDSSTTTSLTYSDVLQASPGAAATVQFILCGDFNSPSEEATLRFDNTNIITLEPDFIATCNVAEWNGTVEEIGQFVNDGELTISVIRTGYVNPDECGGGCDRGRVAFSYTGYGAGTITSPPILFRGFEPGVDRWESVAWRGGGDVTLQILDGDGAPLPDDVVPGNSAGLTQRSVMLWDVDPDQHPVLRLRASLQGDAWLDAWSVTANDRVTWRFDNPGDPAGWVAREMGVSPTLTVAAGGGLRYTSPAGGLDPHILYTFPQPVDAARFTRAEVTLRTGRDWRTEAVTLFWDNNFGEIDPSRSIAVEEVFLLNATTVAFDLTEDRPVGSAWEGQLEAIRIDPVERFLDAAGDPDEGDVVIESITLY